MRLFVGWIKEEEEHKRAFESSSIIRMGRRYLGGTWNVVRKARIVRLIRKAIEEGIIVKGVREIYDEGCRILSEKENLEGEEEEQEYKYMYELYLLKVRGIQKKLKEDEMSVLRRKLEEAERGREDEKRNREAAEREKRGLEERLRRFEVAEIRKREEEEREKKEEEKKYRPITSLDETSVTFTSSDKITRQGNTIIHSGTDSNRNCFIGGIMTSVSSSSSFFF